MPTTPATRRSLRITNSSTHIMKAIATSAARRKECEQTEGQDEASSPGHVQPERPSTRSGSRKSAPATSLQAGNAGNKIITLTPDLGPKLVGDESTKQEHASSDRPQGRIDFDVDKQTDDIPSLSIDVEVDTALRPVTACMFLLC